MTIYPSADGPSLTLANTQKAEASQSSLLAAAPALLLLRHLSTLPVQHKQASQHHNALNHSLLVGIPREQENKVLAFQTPQPQQSYKSPVMCFPTVQGETK